MLALYEDELVCDMAETYHIFNMRELPVRTLATLACGLSAESRVMRKKNQSRISLRDMLLCLAIDKLSQIAWLQSTDGAKGTNRPDSIFQKLTEETTTKSEVVSYATPEEFFAARQKMIGE